MTASAPDSVRIAVAVTTVGRWSVLERLLESLAGSTTRPSIVAIANQSGGPVPRSLARLSGVQFVESSGGISRGRNDALRLLDGCADLVAFPNDHSLFPPETLEAAVRAFTTLGKPAAMAGTLVEADGARLHLPPHGTALTAFSVWKVIEPAMFLSAPLAQAMRFREDLGVGGSSPWQAGEGTDLLLRILEAGQSVISVPDLLVLGDGERRALTTQEWRTKLRSYARGTGYVMRLHRAGPIRSAVHILTPWYRFLYGSGQVRPPAADCFVAMIGRFEGRLGRCLSRPTARLGTDALRK